MAEKNTPLRKRLRNSQPHESVDRLVPDIATEPAEDEGHIPLAAKDSEWADLTYHHTKWKVASPDDEEDQESEISSILPIDDLPIFALFPSLRTTFPQPNTFFSDAVSTTEIARSLVGKKPNFAVMKTSAKLLPAHQNLNSIEEMSPLQEQDGENMEDSTENGEARWSKLALDANQPIEDGVDYLHFFQDRSLNFDSSNYLIANEPEDEDPCANRSKRKELCFI